MNKTSEPLVTIALPTFNRLQGLNRSLECFLAQTYKNLEIVISDNHSDEDPTEMIGSYQKNDSRIKYFRQSSNIGMKANGDFLFSRANGKYFLLGSDDDWWHPNFIEIMVSKLESHPEASCAISNFQESLYDGTQVKFKSKFNLLKHLIGMDAECYPEHLPLLKELTDPIRTIRLMNFIKQSEADGKANVHRSLCRTKFFTESVNELYLLGLTECWGFDQLLAFNLLIKGRLIVSNDLMFKCTVYNKKNYNFETSRIEYLLGFDAILERYCNQEDYLYLRKYINEKFRDKKLGFRSELEDKLYWLFRVNKNLFFQIRQKILKNNFIEAAKSIKMNLPSEQFRYGNQNLKFNPLRYLERKWQLLRWRSF